MAGRSDTAETPCSLLPTRTFHLSDQFNDEQVEAVDPANELDRMPTPRRPMHRPDAVGVVSRGHPSSAASTLPAASRFQRGPHRVAADDAPAGAVRLRVDSGMHEGGRPPTPSFIAARASVGPGWIAHTVRCIRRRRRRRRVRLRDITTPAVRRPRAGTAHGGRRPMKGSRLRTAEFEHGDPLVHGTPRGHFFEIRRRVVGPVEVWQIDTPRFPR